MRSITYPLEQPRLCFSSSTISSHESEIIHKIHSLICKDSFSENILESVVSCVSIPVVNSVIKEVDSVCPRFRFFIWAMRRKRLRSWFSHNFMIETLSEHDDNLNAAWSLLEYLRDNGILIVPQAFNVLISAFTKSGHVHKALEAFSQMHEFGTRPNTFTFNTMLKILIQKGVPQLALVIYSQMIKSTCRPDQSTFNILIDGLCRMGKIQDALGLFDEMIHRGISPNILTYTIILSGHCQANMVDEAYDLYLQMKGSGCRPDSVAYNSLISGFCATGRVYEAFGLIKKEGIEIGLKSYSCLIDGLFKIGKFDEAFDCYKDMVGKKIAPDCVLCTIMIRGFSEAGKIAEALAMMDEMAERGVVPDTFCCNTLIKGLCDAGLLDEARSLKLKISEQCNFPDSATYTILISCLCKQGLVGEAKLLFEEMERVGCPPTVATINALIYGLCKSPQIDEACIFLYKMEMGHNPSLFLRLSHARVTNNEMLDKHLQFLCQTGHLVKAYNLLRELVSSGVTPDVSTYNILINGMCKSKKISAAFKLFNEMQLKGYNPDAVTYRTFIDGLWRENREIDAFILLGQVAKSRLLLNESIYKAFMLSLCRKARTRQAFALWINYLKNVFKDQFTDLLSRAHKEFDHGYLVKATRSLLEVDIILGVIDPSPYSNLLIGFCRSGRISCSLDIFIVLHQHGIGITRQSCKVLVGCLWQKHMFSWATEILLYGLKKGFLSRPFLSVKFTQLFCNNKDEKMLQTANRNE